MEHVYLSPAIRVLAEAGSFAFVLLLTVLVIQTALLLRKWITTLEKENEE